MFLIIVFNFKQAVMKKLFTFLSVGVTALALSAVAVGQMKKARTPYGAPRKVEAEGGMLSAKAQKIESSVGGVSINNPATL